MKLVSFFFSMSLGLSTIALAQNAEFIAPKNDKLFSLSNDRGPCINEVGLVTNGGKVVSVSYRTQDDKGKNSEPANGGNRNYRCGHSF